MQDRVDVVALDPVGGDLFAASLRSIAFEGRILVIGFAGGKPPRLPLNHALVKNIAIHGFYWGGYHRLDPDLLGRDIQALFALWRQGRLRPHAGATLPLDRLPEGYEMLASRRSTGKVIVTL